jgi:hypothetical protein
MNDRELHAQSVMREKLRVGALALGQLLPLPVLGSSMPEQGRACMLHFASRRGGACLPCQFNFPWELRLRRQDKRGRVRA